MFLHHDIRGSSLPLRTVCLTYDDGPGARTRELGQYLFECGIRAAFFVIGRHAEQDHSTLARLRDWGHLIGNHTYNHPGMVEFVQGGGDIVAEVVRTHEIIQKFVSGDCVFLRPPYGSWRQKSRPDGPQDYPTSIVAERLNASGQFPQYIGPIKWDIVGEDWHCWREGITPEEASRRHIEAAERSGRGIILMHDSAAEDDARPLNRTLELTRLLVPALRDRGFRFAGLDEVPEVRDLMAAVRRRKR